MLKIKQWFFNRYYRKHPPEMVKYWKTNDYVKAKVTTGERGEYIMHMEGEKYPFPGFPRGLLLFGTLSKLKHIVKNKLFNETWDELEKGNPNINRIKEDVLNEVAELVEQYKYNMIPPERMALAPREIYRAWSKVEKSLPDTKLYRSQRLKEALTYILQEDDGYRFRVQWLVKYFNPNTWWRKLVRKITKKTIIDEFEYALKMIEHAEMIGDMKERMRLLRRVLLYLLQDVTINKLFNEFAEEVDWNKVKLTKADKYYFRAKYFKVDYPEYGY